MTTVHLADVDIRSTLRPGDLGAIIALHGTVYHRDMGFDVTFEAYVAQTIAEFVLDNAGRGRIWLADHAGRLVGCIAIADREDERGQLRWLLLHPDARGIGLGGVLVDKAMAYCREKRFRQVYLHTMAELDAAYSIYRTLGFEPVGEEEQPMGGEARRIVTMELSLAQAG